LAALALIAALLVCFAPRGTAFALPLPQKAQLNPESLSLKLGNRVFEDLNNNGQRDESEPSVPDILVRLLDEQSDVVSFMRTSSDGTYLFQSLVPGKYSVEIVLPPTYLSSNDAATSTDADNDVDNDDNGVLQLGSVVRSNPVTIGGEGQPESNLTLDFGIWQPASLGDWVWQDNNNDGMQDENETGLPNIEVTLYDADGSAIQTTRTDAGGHYNFVGLTSGDYTIGITLTEGFIFSPRTRGNSREADSDIDPQTQHTTQVSLQPGEDHADVDVGLFPLALQLSIGLSAQPPASQPNDPSTVRPNDLITFTIVVSNIGNSVVSHVVVSNVIPAGAAYLSGTAKPDLDASSSIEQLIWTTPIMGTALSATQRLTFTYAVRVVDNMGNALTKLRNEAAVRSDQTPLAISNRTSHDVVPTTTPGPSIAILVTPDAQTISVGSTAAFTVQVTNTGGFDLYGTEVHPTVATACDRFIGPLAIGESTSYRCQHPSVMKAFTDTWTVISYAGRGSLVLSTYSAAVNLAPTARLGDYVWLDDDGDGLQRANAGVPDVVVRLFRLTQADEVAPSSAISTTDLGVTQTTNAQGFYMFDDVLPGRYTLCAAPPAGYSLARQGSTPGSGVDSDPDPVTGCTRPITATATEMDTNIDVGLVPVVMGLAQSAQPLGNDPRLRINIGDRITYTLLLSNTGLQPARNVVVTDVLSLDVEYISGTAQPTATLGVGQLGWSLGSLGSGEVVTLSFAVRVVGRTDESIQNQAFVQTAQTQPATSNNLVHLFSPTAAQLLSFTGRWAQGMGIELAWQTGAEVDTFGFALYRSETSERDARVRITPEWIAAQSSAGASYRFVDETALTDKRYTYWLVELERDGDVIDYDPITVKTFAAALLNVVAGGVPLVVAPPGAVVAQPIAVLPVNTTSNSNPIQAIEPVSQQAVASPITDERPVSVSSTLSATEYRSAPQTPATNSPPQHPSTNVVAAQAAVAQPTQQAVAQPIATQQPNATHTLVAPRKVIADNHPAPLSARSWPPMRGLMWLLIALVGLFLIASVGGVVLTCSAVKPRGSAQHLPGD
jgi:uncharacterized repeat protein (TIGR01451 family)